MVKWYIILIQTTPFNPTSHLENFSYSANHLTLKVKNTEGANQLLLSAPYFWGLNLNAIGKQLEAFGITSPITFSSKQSVLEAETEAFCAIHEKEHWEPKVGEGLQNGFDFIAAEAIKVAQSETFMSVFKKQGTTTTIKHYR